MKYFILLLFLCVGIIHAQAQLTADGRDFKKIKLVKNLCFDETYYGRIRVTGKLKTNTLNIQDKLLFKKKKYVLKHHNYFNQNGKNTHDTKFVEHENMFPKWYAHPTLIRHDETGSKSYLQGNNKYYNGGWVGDYVTRSEHGEYKVGKNGEKYYSQAYSPMAAKAYEGQQRVAKSFGFLSSRVFTYPSDAILRELQNLGYTTKKKATIITAKSPKHILAWDTKNKVVVSQRTKNGKIVSTTKEFYTLNKHFNEYLLARQETITPSHFSNGDCYEEVSITKYTNYSEKCITHNASARMATNTTASKTLNIYPNPSTDKIQIDIPSTEEATTLRISTVSNQVMMERKLEAGTKSVQLNIKDFPPGMYIAHLHQKNLIYSSKFVKQ